MNILLTGARGFIGRAIRQYLSAAGNHTIITSDQRLNPDTDWENALANVEVVIHAAARVHVMHETASDPLAEFRRVNVEGTLALARQAADKGVKRLIFLSSVKVNGESTLPNQPFTTDDPPAPQDAYGQSKLEAERGLLAIAQQSSMEIVIIRLPLVYGPGVKANFAALLRLVARGIPLPLGALKNRRSLVAIENAVDLIALCITHPAAANQLFLVSDGEDLSTTELLRQIAKAMGRPSRLVSIPTFLLIFIGKILGKQAIMQRLCGSLQVDISKTRTLLGWHPPITCQDALKKTVQNLF